VKKLLDGSLFDSFDSCFEVHCEAAAVKKLLDGSLLDSFDSFVDVYWDAAVEKKLFDGSLFGRVLFISSVSRSVILIRVSINVT